MFRKTILAGSVSLLVFVLVDGAETQNSSTLLDYLAQRATRLAAQLPPLPDSRDAWEKHRTELVGKLHATLGLPARQPMKAAITYSRPDGDLVIEEVAYLLAERAYASATVIRAAKATGRQPAVVIPSGWRGHYTFRAYRKCVDQLARQGVVVLFVDDPRIGLRQSPPAGLYAAGSTLGLQVAGLQVFDALRGLDYLLTRADVDAGKIGIAGLGEGAIQAYLAAALEPRFQFVVAVGGTTTSEALVRAAARGAGPEDPSAFVAGLLNFTDLDRVAACAAPRPVLIAGSAKSGRWPAGGYRQVLTTMKAVYGLYDAGGKIRTLPGETVDDMAPYAPEIVRWLQTDVLPALKSSAVAPAACAPPEKPEFNALASLSQFVPAPSAKPADWPARREELTKRLRQACALDSLKPAADRVGKVTEGDGFVTEELALGVDTDFHCPAVLLRPAAAGAAKCAAVVLSHDDRQCAASGRMAEAARQLVAAGYWVLLPDHASVDPQSRQALASTDEPSFYGDEAGRLYGPADAVGLPPLALRVAENLAAFRHLAARPEVDAGKIVLAGLGLGGVDACLAAALESRAAGAASLDATTMRDWLQTVAPGEQRFYHIMPYLPSLLTVADWDLCYGLLAPRPLLVVRLKDGWPRTGFEQVAATTAEIYKTQQADAALRTLDARGVIEQTEAGQATGVQKPLLAVARTLVPTPPQAGLVGNTEGLKHRRTVDSAVGLIWIAAEMDGYDQQFTGSGYQLQTWSFFNRLGEQRKGYAVTPLIFKQDGEKYMLTGIGKTRINDGTGLQTFPFEPVAGTAEAGDDHFFGWYDGAWDGKPNAGVVEFEDAPDARMIILTRDGQMGGQKLQLGESYRTQSEFRRRYSIMAVSKKP
jgi:dienelactone hydrolase